MRTIDQPTPLDNPNRLLSSILGILAVGGGLLGFAALYVIEVPVPNKDPLMFALGSIFSWGTQVIQSQFGGGRTGNKLADAAANSINNRKDTTE